MRWSEARASALGKIEAVKAKSGRIRKELEGLELSLDELAEMLKAPPRPQESLVTELERQLEQQQKGRLDDSRS